MEQELLKPWILLVAAFLAKSILLSFYQVWLRFRYKLYAAEEDQHLFEVFAKKGNQDTSYAERKLKRSKKCWQNDLESIPLFLFISLGFVLLNQDYFWGVVYMTIYGVSRALHTLFYLLEKQPYRGIAWDTSLVTSIVITIHTLVLAL